jgi:UDP-N-acetylglucosamine--N-acetylmuramyl-(pentapeptide) pyrophosphoryl-undecaprenol N-acetylglucosamine transferase
MRILLAAGGTGGHIMPALAVADALRAIDAGHQVSFCGSGKPLESKLVTNYPLHALSSVPFRGKGPLGVVRFFSSFPQLLIDARRLLKQEKPDVVVGFGGYPSFLPVFSAATMRIPTAIQEQNVHAGGANRVLSAFVDRVYAVRGSGPFLRSSRLTEVSNPVRKEFLSVGPWSAPADQPFRVLVLGGSQGAQSVNRAILKILPQLADLNLSIAHQTGAADADRVLNEYIESGLQKKIELRVLPFIQDVASALASAQLVICRAGAMTVAEVAASGRPAVFIPLPIAGGHQMLNAESLGDGCIIVEQTTGFEDRLLQVVRELRNDADRLAQMASAVRTRALVNGESSAEFLAREILRLATANT